MSLRLSLLLLLWVTPSFAQDDAQPIPPPPLHLLAYGPLQPGMGDIGVHVMSEDGSSSVFSSERLGRTFGAGLLGGLIGGGVGLLVSQAVVEVPHDGPGGAYGPTEAYDLPPRLLGFLGLWLGSSVGVVAGGELELMGESAISIPVGSIFGSLLGSWAGGALDGENGHLGYVAGAVLGASAGAVGGVAIAEAAARAR